MKDKKSINNLYQSLFRALTTDNLDAISKALYEYCLHPVVVYNTLFNVISLFPNQKLNDAVWDNIYQQRKIPSDMLLSFAQDDMIKTFWESKQPKLVNWGLLNSAPRLVTAIRVDGNVVGSVGIVYESNDLESYEEDATALSLAAEAFSMYFKQKKEHRATSKPLHDSFAIALLEGNVTGEEELRYWENIAKISFKNDIRVIVVDCKTKEVSRAVYNRIEEQLVASQNTLMCCLNQSLYFIHYNQPHQSKENYLHRVNAFFPSIKFENVSVGISTAITNPKDILLARYQAEQALHIGRTLKHTSNTTFYEDIAFEDILYKLKENPFFHSYIHPAVFLLLQADEAFGNDYARTLKTYLETFCNKTKTCQRLNIHRNTLSYRLECIQKLAEIDFDDEHTCRHILVSFSLLDNRFELLID